MHSPENNLPKENQEISLREHEYKSESDRFFEALPKADAVIALGSELVRKNGKIFPGIESKMRALGALELLRRGVTKKVLFAGGKMAFPQIDIKEIPDVSISEAMREYIKPYLKQYGIPEDTILIEGESINTTENLENAIKILSKIGDHSFYLLTNEYHLGRAQQILESIIRNKDIKFMGGKTAESVLKNRSAHYENLVAQYEFPRSIKNAPKEALEKGISEFLKRVLIGVGLDKMKTKIAEKVRRK